MNVITKYTWISYTAIRSNLAYVGEVISRTLFMAVILYVFMRLWTVVYAGSGVERLGGLTLQQMVWYLMVTESIFLSSIRISMEIDEDVRTGRLVVQLLRPLSYGHARFAHVAGERLIRLGMNLGIGSLLALLLVGPIHLLPASLLMFGLVLPMTFVVDFLAYYAIGLGAFWLESTTGLALIYARITMLVGGTLLPLEMFPESWQPVVKALPFGSIAYAPARLFVGGSSALLGRTLVIQGSATVLFGTIAWFVQRLALKRIHSHGG